MHDLKPREVVQELNNFIIGQEKAKKAVAIALRNRYRRKILDSELKEEIYPKNIIMIGATGVGKTEIARRLAKMVQAPFIKIEATKFTEVGYVGRDVDSMVRDLVESSFSMVKQEKMQLVEEKAKRLAEERILDYFVPEPRKKTAALNPLEMLFSTPPDQEEDNEAEQLKRKRDGEKKAILREKLKRYELEDETVEIELEEKPASFMEMMSGTGMEEMGINVQELFGGLLPRKRKKKRLTVAEARKVLAYEEAQNLIDMDEVKREAVNRVEQDGIIFLDEIDKITSRESTYGPDVSRGGVQRDILPLIEGATVMTKYGPVKTDHILFIAAGAFHVSKPADLIPELQGRFPIRVELESLTRDDLKRILIEPHNSLIRQYRALLAADHLQVHFTEEAIDYIARVAFEVNNNTENIGARRLHTIMEKVLEDLLFEAPDMESDSVNIDLLYVKQRLEQIVASDDLSRYIL